GGEAEHLLAEAPQAVIADVAGAEDPAVLYDALYRAELPRALLELAAGRKTAKGRSVAVAPSRMPGSNGALGGPADEPIRTGGLDQTNTSVFFGDRLMMKLFRKIEPGDNPEVEVGRFLTEKAGFAHAPRVRGLAMARWNGEDAAFALFQDAVEHQGNAFDLTHSNAVLTLEGILARLDELGPAPRPTHPLDADAELGQGREIMGSTLLEAELLGTRTGELHLALASDDSHPDFAPEPLSMLQQKSLNQAIRSSVRTSMALLRRRRGRLGEDDQELADRVLGAEAEILSRLKQLTGEKIEVDRIRIHGDYHLGQVLNTGRDFVIIDFEGEPLRPLTQRRLKRIGLRDAAGMLRSYHYAMSLASRRVTEESGLGAEESQALAAWAHALYRWAGSAFLTGYLDAVEGSSIIPADDSHTRGLLDALLVEKAAYELDYELNNRPDWVGIPLRGILETSG
ncbi:MAG: alpha-amylase, partial [Actinobacteria bacterium]|nr:alpha-amylase [Actinomycetota bacterium]